MPEAREAENCITSAGERRGGDGGHVPGAGSAPKEAGQQEEKGSHEAPDPGHTREAAQETKGAGRQGRPYNGRHHPRDPGGKRVGEEYLPLPD